MAVENTISGMILQETAIKWRERSLGRPKFFVVRQKTHVVVGPVAPTRTLDSSDGFSLNVAQANCHDKNYALVSWNFLYLKKYRY